MAKSIIINVDDMPAADEIRHAISRLRKDYALLNKIRGKSDKEDPEYIINVAHFLEVLLNREKRTLNKKIPGSGVTSSIDIAINYVADYLDGLDDWEVRQTINETDLNKVIKTLVKVCNETESSNN